MTAPDPSRDTTPVLSRDPAAPLPGELPRGADIPDDLDPLAEGVLMLHQAEWLADTSPLKICAKGRRTGITFAESFDSCLTAATKRSAGGQNVFYIGDTKDKGREYIGYVSHFAKVVAGELGAIEEFLFDDQKDDGTTRQISAFRVKFASGFRVEALSSRPENIRGLQGTVVIDEAAFHKDVRAVLDAVNAMLIWGGPHPDHLVPQRGAEPVQRADPEAQAGKVPYSVHTIPFGDAVRNGLYRRVCLMSGKPWTAEAEAEWEGRIRSSYGARKAAMRQELDAIPAEAAGAALTRVQIEAAAVEAPIVRLTFDDTFRDLDPVTRQAAMTARFEGEIRRHLKALSWAERHVFGVDFARKGDASVIVVKAIEGSLTRRTKLVIELRNCPFEQQRDLLFAIVPLLPRFSGGKLDATGNGAYLAEVTLQKFGADMIEMVMLSQAWYQVHAPRYVDAIAERSCLIARDEDIVQDHQGLQYVGGIIKIPDDHRTKGLDGYDRHGDAAIAGMIANAAADDMRVPARVDTAATLRNEDADLGEDDGSGLFGAFKILGRRLWG